MVCSFSLFHLKPALPSGNAAHKYPSAAASPRTASADDRQRKWQQAKRHRLRDKRKIFNPHIVVGDFLTPIHDAKALT
ncbi:MAG: hypothetical protein ACI9DC_000132 [Gammaproteobacteria bacterium]